ncbi:MAG: hypothetical protein IT560_06440, partial [Alphaproteobacteria bacterium]|nr:hypothetical protein [Alphaproteobacteria bacterium]
KENALKLSRKFMDSVTLRPEGGGKSSPAPAMPKDAPVSQTAPAQKEGAK